MSISFKYIHIGSLIRERMQECTLDTARAAAFLKVSEQEVEVLYEKESIDSSLLLAWSKLLEYDFFRIYSQHLILYAPQDPNKPKRERSSRTSRLPVFKKNIYTPEVIAYLIELVQSGTKSSKQIQNEYNIPQTTITRWLNKYENRDRNK